MLVVLIAIVNVTDNSVIRSLLSCYVITANIKYTTNTMHCLLRCSLPLIKAKLLLFLCLLLISNTVIVTILFTRLLLNITNLLCILNKIFTTLFLLLWCSRYHSILFTNNLLLLCLLPFAIFIFECLQRLFCFFTIFYYSLLC